MINFRQFEQKDAALLVAYLNDVNVTQYITGAIPQPYTLGDAQWWLDVGSHVDYISAIEINGMFVGCISATLGDFEYDRSAELGYWLGREFWDKGIATQAVEQYSQMIFNATNIVRLFVSVVAENKASIRVLEKNNFKQDALLEKASFKKGQFYNEYLFSKISPSFLAQK